MRELERPSPASDGPDGPVNSVGTALQNIFSMLLVGGLEHELYLSIQLGMECHHPK